MTEKQAPYKVKKGNGVSNLVTLRHHTIAPFAAIHTKPVQDPRLSWKAKGILWYLLSRPPGWQMYRSDLLDRSIDARKSLDSGLNELKSLGYLKILPLKNPLTGAFSGWVWEASDNVSVI